MIYKSPSIDKFLQDGGWDILTWGHKDTSNSYIKATFKTTLLGNKQRHFLPTLFQDHDCIWKRTVPKMFLPCSSVINQYMAVALIPQCQRKTLLGACCVPGPPPCAFKERFRIWALKSDQGVGIPASAFSWCGSWASYLTSLCLAFPADKIEIITVPAS